MSRALLLAALFLGTMALADGPGDNIPTKVRPIPPSGITISEKDQQALQKKVAELRDALRQVGEGPKGLAWDAKADAEIMAKAVDWALRYKEFYSADDVKQAYRLLEEGLDRVKRLEQGRPAVSPEGARTVVLSYRSRLDGSIQPYGLVIPVTTGKSPAGGRRLDVWLHGRGEKLSEVNFMANMEKTAKQLQPAGAFVLHPYGRYCNAFKLGGEVDVLEAIEDVCKRYRIDLNRVVMRGFSMGGAGCWTLASHYPGRWVAAAPGAGFSETPLFLKVFQKEKVSPTWYEKRLWRLHDCPGWVENFRNLPVIAYSGEIDSQKQAADVMAEAFKEAGMELPHLIGPKTGHSYHPETKKVLNAKIDAIVEKGRRPAPSKVTFVTYSLRYNESHWVRLEGMQEHLNKARIEAEILDKGESDLRVKTSGVTAFTLRFAPGSYPFAEGKKPKVAIDDNVVSCNSADGGAEWTVSFMKTSKGWELGLPGDKILRKKPGLQGPIDDAFMGSFLIVAPTGKAMHPTTRRWVSSEMEHTVSHWRKQFRGDARVKDDDKVTPEDIRQHHLILWGDPRSNSLIAKILDKLPIRWTEQELAIGETTGSAQTHVASMIYPNPLNPEKYVVLNSGFTIREYDHLNNARQVPKLPDWAVIDVRTPPSPRWPGKVIAADFFDESWKVKKAK